MDLKIGSKNPIHNRKKLSSWKIFIDCPLIKFPSSSFFNARLRGISRRIIRWLGSAKGFTIKFLPSRCKYSSSKDTQHSRKWWRKKNSSEEIRLEALMKLPRRTLIQLIEYLIEFSVSVTASCYTHTISFSIVCVCANGQINEKMCRGSSLI